ncbi:hydrolase, alpha/beta fold family [Myriangium duriaei CBS 260.36]|uniref:alcohol O-acetyltransferase n=1 Tax=Myriangium duriaei CBS 260.36 TaxID=1168546 RepID=A0A9P4J5N5_9PEZI|nr:hydrolase, alpha/beta fold family [Myriangium duriaei CBS 260.36]
MDWLGRARTTFHASPDSLPLHLKDGKTTTLCELVKSTTPPCTLNPALFNGHLQTCWTAVNQSAPPIAYRRKVFDAEDPRFAGTFAVDFVVEAHPEQPDETLPPHTSFFTDAEFEALGGDDDKPLLITLHGLSGGSHEPYLRHVLAELIAKSDDGKSGGWEALVVNSRGCAGSKITSGILYNARATWDVRQVVRWARSKWPNRRLFGIGYSLGANILTNYLGEEGEACELEAAVIVSNPWKLEVSSIALQNTFLGTNLYLKAMGSNMKKLFERQVARHSEQIMKNGNIDMDAVRNIKYLYEFDRAIQCPTWGYPSEGAYYRDASSVDSIFDIRIPCMVLHAEDDPIAVKQAVPYQEVKHTPYVTICSTSLGGHLGWYQIGGGRWHSKPVFNFFEKMLREVDVTATKKHARVDINGVISTTSSHKSPFIFQPMRRKMHLPVEDSR